MDCPRIIHGKKWKIVSVPIDKTWYTQFMLIPSNTVYGLTPYSSSVLHCHIVAGYGHAVVEGWPA